MLLKKGQAQCDSDAKKRPAAPGPSTSIKDEVVKWIFAHCPLSFPAQYPPHKLLHIFYFAYLVVLTRELHYWAPSKDQTDLLQLAVLTLNKTQEISGNTVSGLCEQTFGG